MTEQGGVGPSSFYEWAALSPDRIAVVDPDGSMATYGELAARVNQISGLLRGRGIPVDGNVAVVATNNRRYFEVVLGAGQVGVHAVPVNTHLAADEMAYIVADSASRLVFSDREVAAVTRRALASISFETVRHIEMDGAAEGDRFGEILSHYPADPPPDRVHAGVMLYTAGTTGRPKGVFWPVVAGVTPEAAASAAIPIFRRRGMRVGGTALVVGPLYHGAPGSWGLVGLHHGQTVVLMGRWDSRQALQLVEDHRVTHLQVAPIHLHRLLALPPEERASYDVGSLRAVCHAGAGCPPETKRRAMEWLGPVLYEYYAASEGVATSITPTEWLEHPGSVGHVRSDGATITILDDDEVELAPSVVGRIWVRSTGPRLEYFGDPVKTAETTRSDGSKTFGDMGWVDEDGWLFVSDRRSDMVLSGGVNIYPAEVEQVITTHPSVADAAVVGEPDAEWGQRLVGVVVLRPGARLDAALVGDIEAYCRRRIAGFKCPRRWEQWDLLPYSEAGKLLRRDVRDGLRGSRSAAVPE